MKGGSHTKNVFLSKFFCSNGWIVIQAITIQPLHLKFAQVCITMASIITYNYLLYGGKEPCMCESDPHLAGLIY